MICNNKTSVVLRVGVMEFSSHPFSRAISRIRKRRGCVTWRVFWKKSIGKRVVKTKNRTFSTYCLHTLRIDLPRAWLSVEFSVSIASGWSCPDCGSAEVCDTTKPIVKIKTEAILEKRNCAPALLLLAISKEEALNFFLSLLRIFFL